jgi:cellulose synthase/poly-beta-1,6-N-acetylglucosamine synthase-like glycosyltransferase
LAAEIAAEPPRDERQEVSTTADVGVVPFTHTRVSAINGLPRRTRPRRAPVVRPAAALGEEFSARRTFVPIQTRVLSVLGGATLLALIVNTGATLVLLVGVATIVYLASAVYRLRIFARALSDPQIVDIPDAAAIAVWDRTLPTYTILVPAYREPEVIGGLLRAIEAISYPADRLDVKLLLEADDAETIRAAHAARPAPYVEIVHIPYSEPRTKPKALNVGLASARGRLVTIYDAEDRPEPLQLRRSVAAFRHLDASIACLQAKLSYHNADQNLITKWFTGEYAMWFSQLLPGLIGGAAPVPLGGTSNHFRIEVLRQLGGWDPHNVTEDADLGIRLHRAGYRTRVLDSTTMEEANSDFINWVKQRSRWYKGYLQTWLVHMRDPRRLWRELGPRGFVGFNLFVGGTPLLALLNPIFWALTMLWFIGQFDVIAQLFPAWLYYMSLLCMVFGNLGLFYATILAARISGSPSMTVASLLSPLYWGMMSLAAVKAVLQLVHAPSFWEKTVHGLDRPEETRRAAI